MRNPRELALPLGAALLVLVAGCGKREATPAATTAARTIAPAASVAPVATTASASMAAPAKDAVFSAPELDQMVAPVALYPDPLLAQVLMAATYPGDVADAAAWSKLHLDVKGDAAVQQAASQPWDPSVQSLVAFPQVLATLGQDLGWVQRLGDAFLAQPDDVMDAVQRLRHKAQAAGNLDSNKYQTVSVAPAEAAAAAPAPAQGAMEATPPSETTIVIAPSDPEVIYVPSYNPTEVYGAWDYPAYPPVYYATPPMYTAGSALWRGLAFGTGIAISNALWGDMDWGGNDININTARYNNINVNRNINTGNTTWRHDSLHRDGVPYRDSAHREQFDRRLPGAETREGFRGDDPKRAQAREQARTSMERRGVDTSSAATRDLARQGDAQSRERARADANNAARERARQKSAERDRVAARDAGARDSARRQQSQQNFHARGDSTSQSRQAAQRQRSAQGGTRNNAFQGAGSPQQSRQQAQRGQASHAQARQSSGSRGGSRGGGQPVQRSAPPARQGGGRHR